MASRSVEKGVVRTTAETQLLLSLSFLNSEVPGGDNTGGKLFEKFEYSAMLNCGEQIRCTLNDAFFTMVNPAITNDQSYFRVSNTHAPINIQTKMVWAGSVFATPFLNHVLVGIAPAGRDANQQLVEFVAIDYASWYMNCGDASGASYEGSVSEVIKQVVEKYGHGRLKADVRTQTSDSKKNIWWQYRQDPKTFLKSLFEWSSSITDNKTQWFVYPDPEVDPPTVTFVEQAGMNPVQRSKYWFRGYGGNGKRGHGDILEWEMVSNNSINLFRHKLVTSGISAISGTYYDRVNPDKGDKAKIGDSDVSKRYNPKTTVKGAFTKVDPDSNPLNDPVGWTSISAIPEFSGGELGLGYDDYMDGRARTKYLELDRNVICCRIRVNGHYIWAGSEGLGVDTIEILMETGAGQPHFLKGHWIVYGYKHKMNRKIWYTDLFCMRLDHDASARRTP